MPVTRKSGVFITGNFWQILLRNFINVFVHRAIAMSVSRWMALTFFFFLYIYDIQFTKENKIYNHQVH